jgi:CheY-like chemotaxis protein
MLRTLSWLVRLAALVVVGVATFLHSPASVPVLAAQAAAFVLGTVALSVYVIIDYRFPPAARHVRLLPAARALPAAAGGACTSPNGRPLLALGLIAALAAGSETGMVTSWVITGIGVVAIEISAEHHPDAILLDLHMPGMDGTEAARLLTARHPDVAIVVLTTYADDTSIMAALRAGAGATSPRTPTAPSSPRPCTARPAGCPCSRRPPRPRC